MFPSAYFLLTEIFTRFIYRHKFRPVR